MNTKFNIEKFTEEEKEILSNYFTNFDKPVFGLINMPEVVKGALFARYSRSNKSLRRLFLDEFYKESDHSVTVNLDNKAGLNRADNLFDKVFVEYGDDSVAQLGGAHLACEQASNLLAKIIERGRLAAYLEQSTRYVAYNVKVNDKYHFIVPAELDQSGLGEEYETCISGLFDSYTEIIDLLIPRLKEKFPKNADQSPRAWETTIKAKAYDIARGLLPASTRTNIGIFASGQAYEMMLIKMFASSNQEVIDYATMMLQELRKIIPSFLKRVDLEDRGKLWSKYFADIDREMGLCENRMNLSYSNQEGPNQVSLVDWDKEGLDKVVATALYEYAEISDSDLSELVKKLPKEEKTKILEAYIGNRKNRRHKPGRAFETLFYRFDILSDYGAFRDLQRHRMLTIQWQKLSPKNGYSIPEELEEFPEIKLLFINALERTVKVYDSIKQHFNASLAQYVVPFAFNIRYMINLNLREAIHLIELRTQKQGHPSYRKVCLEMYDQILKKTDHKELLNALNFVDHSHYQLSREDAEKKIDLKLQIN